MELRPHKSKYWMHPKIDDYKEFEQRLEMINNLYAQAGTLKLQGVNVVSVDEKTGMQAKEKIKPDLGSRPGKTRCEEFEYIRHGTQCLTANLEVATGKVIAPTIGQTRKEPDFLKHIQGTVATAPEQGWIFILDNLNTHISASLVEWVAEALNLEVDLGKKQYKGILKDQQSRRSFLENPDHRIRFAFTPKHCSWLNQIEIWFSKLSKRILNKGSFKSTDQLKEMVRKFIDYHNLEAKPYKWNCKPKEVVRKIKTALNSTGNLELMY